MDTTARARSLRLSILEGALHAVMVGVSESYLGALAVKLGHADAELAWLGAGPMVIGALSQLASPWAQRQLGSRRRFIILGAVLQGLAHLGLLAIALQGQPAFWPFLAVKALYWASGMGIGPAWNVWIGALTQDIDRNRYLARRTSIVSATLLTAYVSAGLALQWAPALMGGVMPVFASLHALALAARLVSAALFWRHLDLPLPPYEPGATRRRMRAALGSLRGGVVGLQVSFQFGAALAFPLFAPYILRDLRLDLIDFMLIMGASMLSKAALTTTLGRLVKRVGLRAALFTGMLGVASATALWTVLSSVPAICAAQLLGGASWALIELSMLQLLLGEAREDARAELFAVSTSLTSLAQLAAGLLGASLVHVLGGYREVILLSASLRALPALIVLMPRFRAQLVQMPGLFFRIISARADGGQIRLPILDPKRKKDPKE
jgi:MFS family permease